MSGSLHISIPEPCHENWQTMTPNEQGRHCMSCQKTVVDFSVMSDREILHYISTASSQVCGNFTNNQLNKNYAEKKRPFSWRYAWNMIVATFLVTGNGAMAQGKVVTKGEVAIAKAPPKPVIKRSLGLVAVVIPDTLSKGAILDDSTGKPVSFASVRMRNVETGIAANEGGKFSLATEVSNKIILVVSAVGYTTREYEVMPGNSNNLQIRLIPEARQLKAVEVIAYNSSRRGDVRLVRVTTISETFSRKLNEWLPKKDVRVYPNPVIPGNSVTVSLNLKETGDYRMELLDASGRLVWVQAAQINLQTQTVSIPTQAAWSRGVYWLRISNGKIKKVYQAKVLLQ